MEWNGVEWNERKSLGVESEGWEEDLEEIEDLEWRLRMENGCFGNWICKSGEKWKRFGREMRWMKK